MHLMKNPYYLCYDDDACQGRNFYRFFLEMLVTMEGLGWLSLFGNIMMGLKKRTPSPRSYKLPSSQQTGEKCQQTAVVRNKTRRINLTVVIARTRKTGALSRFDTRNIAHVIRSPFKVHQNNASFLPSSLTDTLPFFLLASNTERLRYVFVVTVRRRSISK
jgi:hypothetical protein